MCSYLGSMTVRFLGNAFISNLFTGNAFTGNALTGNALTGNDADEGWLAKISRTNILAAHPLLISSTSNPQPIRTYRSHICQVTGVLGNSGRKRS